MPPSEFGPSEMSTRATSKDWPDANSKALFESVAFASVSIDG